MPCAGEVEEGASRRTELADGELRGKAAPSDGGGRDLGFWEAEARAVVVGWSERSARRWRVRARALAGTNGAAALGSGERGEGRERTGVAYGRKRK